MFSVKDVPDPVFLLKEKIDTLAYGLRHEIMQRKNVQYQVDELRKHMQNHAESMKEKDLKVALSSISSNKSMSPIEQDIAGKK